LKNYANVMVFSPPNPAWMLNAIRLGQQDEAVWNTELAGDLKARPGTR
jgi:hypothetical protein